jgi:hypothetical protein
VVEVAVREEEVARAGELQGAPADVEGEPRRVDAEPVVIPGPRPPLDAQVAEAQLRRSR